MSDKHNFNHAILMTYIDMESCILPGFIAKARRKYTDFIIVRFDSTVENIKNLLQRVVERIPVDDTLKLFISGHGATGVQYISDNSEHRTKSVDELADMLADGLRPPNLVREKKPLRCSSKDTAAKTQVNMIACQFGRTPDGSMDSCPAVILHRKLADKGVYVELVARTESINYIENAKGRQTVSLINEARAKSMGQRPDRYKGRKQYTKILCTFVRGAGPVVVLKSYQESADDLPVDAIEGRRILWAENVVNEFVKYIKFSKTGEVNDVRQHKMWDLVRCFDNSRNPKLLKEEMEKVLSGKGVGDRENFTTHWLYRLPEEGQLVENLLRKYPS
jgi:hypothetical protein